MSSDAFSNRRARADARQTWRALTGDNRIKNQLRPIQTVLVNFSSPKPKLSALRQKSLRPL